MAKISVSEAAKRLDVGVQRVHQRIADGSLPAERVGQQWVIDEVDVARLDRRPAGRPLSSKSVWNLLAVAAQDEAELLPDAWVDASVAPRPQGVDKELSIAASDRSRARARLRDLLLQVRQSAEPQDDASAAFELAAHLRSVLQSRAKRRLFRASPLDLDDLRLDSRVQLSGISLPISGIASGDIVEGYVASHHLEQLVSDFLLIGARPSEANVVLHVVDPAVAPYQQVQPQSPLLLAADLAEYHQPREVAKAARILREFAERHPSAQPVISR